MSLSFGNGSMCMPVCVCMCVCIISCAWVCFCVIAFWQTGRCCGRGGRSCRRAVCLSGQHHDNSCSLTPAYGCHCHLHAVTQLQPAQSSVQRPFHGPRCCEAASWGLNSGNWVVNILKCSSTWVYFTPVIRLLWLLNRGLLHLQELFHHYNLLLLLWSSKFSKLNEMLIAIIHHAT